jgi:RNase P/RNase MRP subunit POP5
MAMTVQDNTPSAGYIRWSGVSIAYKGTTYSIANGATNYHYIYWLYSNPTVFYGSDAFPTLGDDDILVFINKNGIHAVVPNTTVVDGSLIVPQSILTNAIAANAITSDQIAANAVTAGKISAGAVTANTIAAGAVGADKIAAQSIAATKLVMADFNNLATVNEDFPSTVHNIFGGVQITGGFIKKMTPAQQYLMVSDFIVNPFLTNDEIMCQFNAKAAANGNVDVRIWFYDANKNVLVSHGATQAITTTETTYQIPIKLTNANVSNAVYVVVGFDCANVDLSVRYNLWRKRGAAQLIVDGSITANQISVSNLAAISANLGTITAGTIDASLVNINNINASKINTGVLDASKVTVQNLSANVIQTGTLDASKVVVSNLSASSIVSGTLDASRVTVQNLSASVIQTGTLDASKVTVSNLSASVIQTGTLDASKVSVTNLNASNIKSGILDASKITVSNLSASVIQTGTLDASKVTVQNLDASSITSGTLSAITINGATIISGQSGFTNDNWLQMDDGGLTIYLDGSPVGLSPTSYAGEISFTPIWDTTLGKVGSSLKTYTPLGDILIQSYRNGNITLDVGAGGGGSSINLNTNAGMVNVNSAMSVSGALSVQGAISPKTNWTNFYSSLGLSWVVYGNGYNYPSYYKDALGMVRLRGTMKSGSNGVFYTMPAGLRPANKLAFPIVCGASGTQVGYLTVDSTGGLNIQVPSGGNAWVPLDGITWFAEV